MILEENVLTVPDGRRIQGDIDKKEIEKKTAAVHIILAVTHGAEAGVHIEIGVIDVSDQEVVVMMITGEVGDQTMKIKGQENLITAVTEIRKKTHHHHQKDTRSKMIHIEENRNGMV